MSAPLDWIIGTMKLIKDNWSLTGDLTKNNIKFTTGFYNEQVGTPQISITPLVEPYRVITIGPSPTYFINRILQIHVWVRPPTSSNTALGQAKNARYQMGTAIER